MPAYLSPIGNDQFIDVNGNPLNGGKIYTYLAGTSTPAGTWTTSAGTVAQTNPVIINSLGATANPIWLSAGVAYKFVIKDSTDVTTLYTFDNITGINDPAYSLLSEWVLYNGAPTYVAPTIFSLLTDQTTVFQPGRRIKTTNTGGTIYSTIQTSVFATGVTTITVLNDSGVLDSGLSAVYYGFLSATSPSVPSTASGLNLTPFRNVIINGDFAVDQRNQGLAQTISSTVLTWCADMFYAIGSGAAPSGRNLIQPDGSYRYRMFGSSGNTTNALGTRIESVNCIYLAGQAATFSCKSSTTTPTSMTWAAYYPTSGTDAFGGPGAYTRTLIATGVFSITATEQTYGASFNVPSSAYKGIEIVLSIGALPNGSYWDVGYVQLEKGTIPLSSVSFENVDITLQTLRCQRYQYAVNENVGIAYAANATYTPKIQFPVEMRIPPAFDGTVTTPIFIPNGGAAGTPALVAGTGFPASKKSVFYNNSGAAWTVGAIIQLRALIACNIP